MKKSFLTVLMLAVLMASQVSAIACGLEGSSSKGENSGSSEEGEE